MLYQIAHGKALVQGHVSRPPQEAFAFMDSVPFLSQLRQHNVMDPALVDVSGQLQTLAGADIRYIILHKRLATAEQLTAWQDWLTIEPFHEDADLIVYTTDPQWGRDFTLAHRLTEKIGIIRAAFTPTSTIQGAVVRTDARWGSTAAPDQDYDVCLNLVNPSGEVVQSHCESLSPTWPTSRWNASEVVRGTHTLHVDHLLEPGTYSLTLTLANGDTGAQAGQSATLGLLPVEALQPEHPLQVLWGNAISLQGYDLHQSAEMLELTIYWQAQRRMDTSYKFFVHLINPVTGDIIAQDDAVPRRWTYPTTEWKRDEVVQDTISLPLDGGPGQYHLMVGFYDPGTGERLPAYTADGERSPDDAVPLTTVQH
jgi:hypothetical protein